MALIDIKKLSTTELKALGWDQARIRDKAGQAVAQIEEELMARELWALNIGSRDEQSTDGRMGDDKTPSDG